MSIVPVEGGQYRFAYKSDLINSFIGVFYSYSTANATFDVDLYVQAFTPCEEVPMKFVGLIGLPDLKRHDELTWFGMKTSDIIILDRLYICKNSIFQNRHAQWRLGSTHG